MTKVGKSFKTMALRGSRAVISRLSPSFHNLAPFFKDYTILLLLLLILLSLFFHLFCLILSLDLVRHAGTEKLSSRSSVSRPPAWTQQAWLQLFCKKEKTERSQSCREKARFGLLASSAELGFHRDHSPFPHLVLGSLRQRRAPEGLVANQFLAPSQHFTDKAALERRDRAKVYQV